MPTQLYTAIPNDVITAARWNNEFGNLYNNVLFSSLTATGTASPRPVADRFADVLNVKDYGAIGDGVVDDQSALVAAVAAAASAGKGLFWPAGTYKTTATIASFHSVKHYGTGVVNRSGTQFYITPTTSSHTNAIYVSTTGSDSNDGLSSSQPVLTVQKSFDIAHHWSPLKFGWTIWLAAGTYSEAASLESHTSFNDDYLTIRGPVVATVQTVPTAIIDYPGSGSGGIDLNWHNKCIVRDIMFTDWLTPASGGLLADSGCVLWTYNVHTKNCRQGIVGTDCKLYVQGGIHTGLEGWTTGSHPGGGGSVGVVTYAGAHCSLGYGATSLATGTILQNFVSRAYEGKANTHCVSTWCTFASNELAVFLYSNSRFDDRTNAFKKNRLVYKCYESTLTSDQSLGASDYNYGETYAQGPSDVGDGNYSMWRMNGGSTDESMLHGDGTNSDPAGIMPQDIAHSRESTAHTGTIAETLTRTLATIRAGALAVSETYAYNYEVFLTGASTGAAAAKTVVLKLGSVTLTTLTIATGTVTWTARIQIWPTSNDTSVIQITEASNATITAVRATVAALDHWTDADLAVYTTVPGAADTATLHECKVVRWG